MFNWNERQAQSVQSLEMSDNLRPEEFEWKILFMKLKQTLTEPHNSWVFERDWIHILKFASSFIVFLLSGAPFVFAI